MSRRRPVDVEREEGRNGQKDGGREEKKRDGRKEGHTMEG